MIFFTQVMDYEKQNNYEGENVLKYIYAMTYGRYLQFFKSKVEL